MKKVLCLLACCLLMAGCASKPVPDWAGASYGQLEVYKKNFLQGKDRLAEISFRKAVEELKATGDLNLLEMAYLTRYSLQVALLEGFDDRDYLRMAALEANPANIHFHLFLKGAFEKVDEGRLSPQYRSFLHACRKGKQAAVDQALGAIEDPLSRLIAAGLAVQTKHHSEATLNVAIRTASEQGWKKALLVYMERLRSDYESNNERQKAEAIRQRIELLK